MSKPPRLQQRNEHWYVAYTKDGRSKRDSLRTTDLQVAEVRFQGWLKERRLNIQIEHDPTIEHCLELWMDQWIAGNMLSENRYTAIVNNLSSYFGKMRVSEVSRLHSRKYIEMRTNGLIGSNKAASGTIRGELQRLRASFRFMVERVEPREQRLPLDIIPYIELPPASPPRDRVLSDDEVNLLREVCGNHVVNGMGRRPSNRMSRVGRFVMIALETAQRKTSIEELQWDQIDFKRNTITFNPVGRLQTIKKRPTIPISPHLRPTLERAKQEALNNYVLDKSTSLYEAVKTLGTNLGIDGLHPHVFRHTWATRAVTRGVSLSKVAMFLGDSEKTVRANYQHLAPDYLNDVFET